MRLTNRKFYIGLLVFSILLVLGASAHPLVSNGRGSGSMSTEPSTNGKRGSICTTKGMMCEALCKNNPQAGGKVCNCDNYVLSNRVNRVYQGCQGGLI